MSGDTDSGGGHDNRPRFLSLHYIIRIKSEIPMQATLTMHMRWAGLVLAVLFSAPAAGDDVKSAAGNLAISREAFFAAAAAKGNQSAVLPSLTYWGVRGAVWGTPAANLPQVAPALAKAAAPPAAPAPAAKAPVPAAKGGAPAATAKGAAPPPPPAPAAAPRQDPECIVGGLRCDSSVDFGPAGLSKVQYRFATGVTDRRTELGMYRTLMSALQESYGNPSRHVRPQEEVRGEDAYVQGLDPRYEVQWSGRETNVALELSDRELAITFTPAVRSRAAVRERELNEFRQQVQPLPAGHTLKKMLAQ